MGDTYHLPKCAARRWWWTAVSAGFSAWQSTYGQDPVGSCDTAIATAVTAAAAAAQPTIETAGATRAA
jgi:hypothetical protein